MNIRAPESSGFLRPIWKRAFGSPWVLSLVALALLATVRYLAVFGPPTVRILFPLHCLVMWALPFIFLTVQGRRQIGLRRPVRIISSFVLSAIVGAVSGLAIYFIGSALFGNSPDNWCVSIGEAFQLKQLLGLMPRAAVFAVIALPAMILTPIGEEILFRGLIQQAFTFRWSERVAIVVNGLAFGLIHLHVHGLWRDPSGLHLRLVSGGMMILLLAFASAVFTICRLRTGSLFAAMVAHAFCNLAMISAVFFHYIG